MEGRAQGIAFVFAGTDECLEDRRRGLFSYEALKRRLVPHRYSTDTHKDYSSLVMKLDSLTPEDCYVLLDNIRRVFAAGDSAKHLVPDEAIVEYLRSCNERMGAAYFQTPSDTVRGFVGLLSVLEQNPSLNWQTALQGTELPRSTAPRDAVPDEQNQASDDDDLSRLKL